MMDPHDQNLVPSPDPVTATLLNPWFSSARVTCPLDKECRKYANPECYQRSLEGQKLRKAAQCLVQQVTKKSQENAAFDCEQVDFSCKEDWLLVKEIDNPCKLSDCVGKPCNVKENTPECSRKASPKTKTIEEILDVAAKKNPRKRNVSFADDAGMCLTSTCVMTSLSKCKYVTDETTEQRKHEEIIEELESSQERDEDQKPSAAEEKTSDDKGGAGAGAEAGAGADSATIVPDVAAADASTVLETFKLKDDTLNKKWRQKCPVGILEPQFSPPMDNFKVFIERLQRDCVALEKIKIERNQRVLGTIKVLDLEEQKDVLVRYSSDRWQSYVDVKCVNDRSVTIDGAVSLKSFTFNCDLVDVFTFDFSVPFDICSISFSILYQSGAKEYWDNNCGRNYEINRVCY